MLCVWVIYQSERFLLYDGVLVSVSLNPQDKFVHHIKITNRAEAKYLKAETLLSCDYFNMLLSSLGHALCWLKSCWAGNFREFYHKVFVYPIEHVTLIKQLLHLTLTATLYTSASKRISCSNNSRSSSTSNSIQNVEALEISSATKIRTKYLFARALF